MKSIISNVEAAKSTKIKQKKQRTLYVTYRELWKKSPQWIQQLSKKFGLRESLELMVYWKLNEGHFNRAMWLVFSHPLDIWQDLFSKTYDPVDLSGDWNEKVRLVFPRRHLFFVNPLIAGSIEYLYGYVENGAVGTSLSIEDPRYVSFFCIHDLQCRCYSNVHHRKCGDVWSWSIVFKQVWKVIYLNC